MLALIRGSKPTRGLSDERQARRQVRRRAGRQVRETKMNLVGQAHLTANSEERASFLPGLLFRREGLNSVAVGGWGWVGGVGWGGLLGARGNRFQVQHHGERGNVG